MNSGPEQVLNTDGEGEVVVVRHWGCRLERPDGTTYSTRWDPGYGSGVQVPYSEAEARADVVRVNAESSSYKGVLVKRTETTLVVTTRWEVVE